MSSSLSTTLESPWLNEQIQHIKSLLYDKKFLEVFENEDLLAAYGARWVPSRALAFREIFEDVDLVRRRLVIKGKGKAADEEERRQVVVCLGGGAGSELLAIAGLLGEINRTAGLLPEQTKVESAPVEVHMLDIGPYGSLVDTFGNGIRQELPLLTPERMSILFSQTDILASQAGATKPDGFEISLSSSSPDKPPIITLLFTITELFVQSKAKTILFLRRLTDLAPVGTLFLVVDSANEEASAVQVGSQGRAFGLASILDGLLCSDIVQKNGDDVVRRKDWRCVEKVDTRWFRLREGLQEFYPIKLENTRYWLRLYKKM